MLHRKGLLALVIVGALSLIVAGQAISQDGGRDGRGDRGGRGQRDPEQMRQMMERFRQRNAERMKERLGVNDEEWKILAPRVEKTQTLVRDASGAGMRGMRGGRRGGRGGAPAMPEQEQTAVQKKTEALRTLLENESAKPAEIKAALAELRKAREKARQELAVARKQLREVVTLRQEAQLVLMGLLD